LHDIKLATMIVVSVRRCVCHAATLSFGVQKTAEQIEVLFGLKTLGGPRNIVLDRSRSPTMRRRGSTFDAAFAKLLWPLVSF